MHMCSVAKSCPTICDLMDCSPPGSLSMEFSRQEYWSGLPSLSPGNLPNPGIELTSPVSPELAGRFFTTESLGNSCMYVCVCVYMCVYIYIYMYTHTHTHTHINTHTHTHTHFKSKPKQEFPWWSRS